MKHNPELVEAVVVEYLLLRCFGNYDDSIRATNNILTAHLSWLESQGMVIVPGDVLHSLWHSEAIAQDNSEEEAMEYANDMISAYQAEQKGQSGDID